MKIERVEALSLAGSGDQGTYGAPYGLLARVTTDDGLVGWGEADSHPDMLKAVIEAPFHNELMSGLAAVVVGRDARDTDGAWEAMARAVTNAGRDGVTRMAMAAIDVALWDIKGKAAGKPVHALLGTARRKALPYYASHPLGETLEETAAHARKVRGLGVPGCKFGWYPLGQDARQDEAIVATLREALGPDIRLLIDGGLAFDAEGAIERTRMMARHGVYWLEEALPAYDVDGYRRLRRSAAVTIAAGEMASDIGELSRLILNGCVDVLQIDLARVGITQALRVAEIAERHGVRCVNHTYTLDWNLAASLHVMAVIPSVDLFEYQVTPNEIRQSLVPERPKVAGGMIHVPDKPGLGADPDPEVLARFVQRS